MLDRDFLADGGLPLPKPPANGTHDSTAHNAAPILSTIRAKAERIVALLSEIDGGRQADPNLCLAEELAQDIAELCPACGSPPGGIH